MLRRTFQETCVVFRENQTKHLHLSTDLQDGFLQVLDKLTLVVFITSIKCKQHFAIYVGSQPNAIFVAWKLKVNTLVNYGCTITLFMHITLKHYSAICSITSLYL